MTAQSWAATPTNEGALQAMHSVVLVMACVVGIVSQRMGPSLLVSDVEECSQAICAHLQPKLKAFCFGFCDIWSTSSVLEIYDFS